MSSMPWVRLYREILNNSSIGILPDNEWRFLIELIIIADDKCKLPELETIAFLTRRRYKSIIPIYDKFVNMNIIGKWIDGDFLDLQLSLISIHKSDWRILPPKIRKRIFEDYQYTCVYCGEKAQHIDHIIPVSRGGTDELENLVASCARCNLSKNDKTPEEAGMVIRYGKL